jgi:hypothetical protein
MDEILISACAYDRARFGDHGPARLFVAGGEQKDRGLHE